MRQRIRKLAIAAIGTAMFATAACAAGSGTPVKLNSSDHRFLADALSANQLEIDFSTCAAKQASSEKVRQFAQAMVAEHTRLATDMQAANDGLTPTPAPTQQPGVNLAGRKGAEFDRAYMALMVAYDNAALGKFKTADGPQHSAAIRDMVKKVLPAIGRNDVAAKALQHALASK